ncbi:glycosyltransferase family 2 protein [Arthrobacter sp. RAF14]|uniref:glycosyltransferase family 2 protein n=1 Tax=Arthrobacter sp. RAF14 TaxID=3233051 RepID=UPI003F93B4C3
MPRLEVIIPVHSEHRPLGRAMASVLGESPQTDVHVTVVCHNITADRIAGTLEQLPPAGRVSFLEFRDGINSPAGPKNFGIAASDSEYLTVLDSDDHLDPGALDVWTDSAVENRAGLVAPRLKNENGQRIRTPRSRWRRHHDLDPAKDGLAYATAPRGLWRRSLLESTGERYTNGLRTGEDLALGLRLWFSGTRIEHPVRGAYILTGDGNDRVTDQRWTVEEQLEPLLRLDLEWLQSLRTSERRAIATKLWRTNVIGAAVSQAGTSVFPSATELDVFRRLGAFLERVAPLNRLPLSVAEEGLASALLRSETTEKVADGICGFLNSSVSQKIMTRSPGLMCAADSPFRSLLRARLPE